MTNFTLKFGKYKGQQFLSTPVSYQNWLTQQDWFKIPNDAISVDNNSYALIENGIIHTDYICKQDAEEMLERHRSCFPLSSWSIAKMSEVKGIEKLEGMLERHMRISAKY
jgi:hypothetical protein